MKKMVIFLVLLMVFIFPSQCVFASSIVGKLTTNKQELQAEEIVEINFSFTDFKDIKKGINAYRGILEYDKNIFEEVRETDFSSLNNWEKIKYNPQNGQFISYRKVGEKKEEVVFKLSLKVKNNINPTNTMISVKNIEYSEGKKDQYIQDVNIMFNILKEQQKIPDKLDSYHKPNKVINNMNSIGMLFVNKIDDITSSTFDSEDNSHDNTALEEKEDDFDNSSAYENAENDSPKIKSTTHKYTWILLFILSQLVIIIIFYLRHKTKNNRSINISLFLLGLIFTEFIGTTFVFAYNFSLKGELNNDSAINYADVSLLELHLIDLKKLNDDKLENADMNGDGKITVTDLSILVQKIEKTLEYDVEIVNIDIENIFPNKNQEILVKFNADISYGANIKKIIINNQEYKVDKDLNTSLYIIKINSGDSAGIKDYVINEVLLDNEKIVKVNYSFKLDVLKDIPYIENYRVEENKDDSKLILLFKVVDNEDSIESSYVELFDDNQNRLTQEKIKKGENRIELSVEEKKEYLANIVLNYNLSNTSEDESHKGVQSYEKELQLLIDYNFTFENLKTYKEDQETMIFNKEDKIKIGFESTNSTKYVPEIIKVDGKKWKISRYIRCDY